MHGQLPVAAMIGSRCSSSRTVVVAVVPRLRHLDYHHHHHYPLQSRQLTINCYNSAALQLVLLDSRRHSHGCSSATYPLSPSTASSSSLSLSPPSLSSSFIPAGRSEATARFLSASAAASAATPPSNLAPFRRARWEYRSPFSPPLASGARRLLVRMAHSRASKKRKSRSLLSETSSNHAGPGADSSSNFGASGFFDDFFDDGRSNLEESSSSGFAVKMAKEPKRRKDKQSKAAAVVVEEPPKPATRSDRGKKGRSKSSSALSAPKTIPSAPPAPQIHRVERHIPPPIPPAHTYLGKEKMLPREFVQFYLEKMNLPAADYEAQLSSHVEMPTTTKPKSKGKGKGFRRAKVEEWVSSPAIEAHIGPEAENVPFIRVHGSARTKRIAEYRGAEELAARLLHHVFTKELVQEFHESRMGYGERLNQLLEKPVEAHIPEAKLDEFSTLQQEFAEKKVFLVPAAVSTASAVSTSTSERRSFNPRRSHSRTFSRKLPVPPPFLLRSKDLPMYSYYGELMAAIDENPVVVISAETGAGKTTQLPQFILAFESEKRKAATAALSDSGRRRGGESQHVDRTSGLNEKPIKVIVTQPRRIAAISVAQRVAQERGETIGKNSAVGYTVRFDEMRPRSDPSEGQIVFCTSGILLRIFQENPDLDDITHLILDEVHERDLNTDLLLILTRQLVMRRPDIKIILMSATADTELFARYFTVPQYLPQPPVISVPGRLFPVEATFLPDVVNLVKPLTSDRMLSKDTTTYIRRQLYGDSGSGAGDRNGPTRSNSYDIARNRTAILDDGRTDAVPIDLIEALIVHIVEKKSDGAILVFLPSWADISTLQSRLKDEDFFQKGFGDPTRYRIFPMHSSVPNADQREVFEKSPPGVRKIVLATNIAETSVTINDVVYVIDSAKIRVASYDPNSRVSSLNSVFASRSNLKQRMGRAGRCQPGEYYSLITKSKHQALPYSLPPELLRVDLQSTVLKIASLDRLMANIRAENEQRRRNYPREPKWSSSWSSSSSSSSSRMSVVTAVTAFLEQAPVPPSRSSIDEAVTSLRSLGAIGIVEENVQMSENDPSGWKAKNGVAPVKRRKVESVTLIGRVLSNFSVDPWVGRMVLLGLAMRCLDPILTIACLTGGGEGGAGGSVFSMRPEDRYVARRVIAATFSRDGNASDLITAANAFYAWREVIRTKGMTAAREFAFDNHLSFIAMQNLEKARQQLFAQLKSARLVDGRFSDRDERLGGAAANEHADNARLIRAIICSGMLPNVAEVARKDEYRMDGNRLRLTGSSVNSGTMTQVAAIAARYEQDGGESGGDPVALIKRLAVLEAASNESVEPEAAYSRYDSAFPEPRTESGEAADRKLATRVPIVLPPRLLCFQERQRVDYQTYMRQTTAADPMALLLFAPAAVDVTVVQHLDSLRRGADGTRPIRANASDTGLVPSGRPLAWSVVSSPAESEESGGEDKETKGERGDDASSSSSLSSEAGLVSTFIGGGIRVRTSASEAEIINALRAMLTRYVDWLVWSRSYAGVRAAAAAAAREERDTVERGATATAEGEAGAGAVVRAGDAERAGAALVSYVASIL